MTNDHRSTDRLYYTDPARLTFDASVVAVHPLAQGARLALDRTAFYPASGGQPHDVGHLGDVPVLDVLDDEDGVVWHVVDRPLAVGTAVVGVIDAARRRDHMQQHSGQHLLSAAFERVAGVRTESFHLGTDASTIDLAREVHGAELRDAVAEANRVVWEDRPVTIRFVSAEAASTLPLRKEPARSGPLRLIDVEGFDLSACGGTHVARTGEVGLIAVRRVERFKGGSRVEFVCGGRALRAFEQMTDLLDRACRPLSIGAADLPATIERLQAAAREQQRLLTDMSARLAAFEASRLVDRAEPIGVWRIVVAALDGLEARDLKSVASDFVATPGRVAALVGSGAPAPVVVARSADVPLDAGACLKQLTASLGGRGGGRPDLAQGGLTGTPESLVPAMRAAVVDGLTRP